MFSCFFNGVGGELHAYEKMEGVCECTYIHTYIHTCTQWYITTHAAFSVKRQRRNKKQNLLKSDSASYCNHKILCNV